jgi:ribonucleoside-diphosphate reductase alpha chain
LTLKFIHGGIKHYGTASLYSDGRLAEIFLDAGKPGSALQAALKETAVAASHAFQHGCAAETLRASVPRDDNGAAAGPLGVLLDLLEKELNGGHQTFKT